jgi:hypothetical protein
MNGTCDCGCGLVDPDCSIESRDYCQNYPVEGCSGGNRSNINPTHAALCTKSVPSGWTCDRGFFGDGLCDCGCGGTDADCKKADVSACAKCNDAGSCSTASCPGTITASDNAHCSN